MMQIHAISTQQMAEIDRLMIDEYGIQLIQMMENAGRNLAEMGRRILGGNVNEKRIAVLCGAGNNGGGALWLPATCITGVLISRFNSLLLRKG